jgi:hypothetical protein
LSYYGTAFTETQPTDGDLLPAEERTALWDPIEDPGLEAELLSESDEDLANDEEELDADRDIAPDGGH